jgi:hypothetical protein
MTQSPTVRLLTEANADAVVTTAATTPGAGLNTALNATFVLKTDLPPTSLDGGNASSTYGGTSFNFDGGSAA